MEFSSVLFAVIMILGATAVCVILFERLGFGSVLGFIVAGILIGPHTPGPVASAQVKEIQHVAEIGVVLFMFIVGLEMRPTKVWAMRRLMFGLGTAQWLGTAVLIGGYAYLFGENLSWASALVLGLGLAMASTAIIMTTLTERGELSSEHGRTSFAILMAQDLWIVPAMALVPLLAQKKSDMPAVDAWEQGLLVLAVLAGIFIVGRYVLPAVLGYTARRRRMDAFAIALFLAIISAAWMVEHVGISMTLGAFVMGMLLSASDHRYQIEATVGPFKDTLMGLFFLAVGMSIDVGALINDWPTLFAHLPVIIALKVVAVIALALAFGASRAAAIRSGFFLSQAGELAFVLFGAAAAADLLPPRTFTLAMLAVAASMVLTPVMIKAGDWLAERFQGGPAGGDDATDAALDRHVVIVGFEEVGQLLSMMLEVAGIPYIAFDNEIDPVLQGKHAGRNVHFGNMYDAATQHAASLAKAAAVIVTSQNPKRAEGLAITLQRLYPKISVYVRVRTLADQDRLLAKGIKHAGTGYIEGTLTRGKGVLMDLGVSEEDAGALVDSFQQDNYALVRAAYVDTKEQ